MIYDRKEGKGLASQNINIHYNDTPEKFREEADGVIAYLVENLLILNAIEEECARFKSYQERGIRLKGMPKDSDGLWQLYKKRYGEAAAAFCAEELLARGYAQSMAGVRCVFAADGTLVEAKIYGQYAYLNDGCELAITMKSNKRAIIEVFYTSKDRLNHWQRFDLANTGKWRLTDIKQKRHLEDKWRKDTL